MIRLAKYLFVLLLAIAAAVFLYVNYLKPDQDDSIAVRQGRINNVEEIARLCSMDLYSEVPMLDTINGKVMFAIQKQRGSISFDLEKLIIDDSGDTVIITLPPEIIELREATDNNSWEVIDTKAVGRLAVFRSDRISDVEENALKRRMRSRSKKRLYENGTVARARAEGADHLRHLMEKLYRRPVIILDPTPSGTPR